MSTDDLINVGIALFLLVGIGAVMAWDRISWKRETRRAAHEEDKSE
jgi:hypothetical protein